MEYDEEKHNGINCMNSKCRFYDGRYEQNCSAGDEWDNPAIVGCLKYIPADWNFLYDTKIDGKTLEAMKFLAEWALKQIPPLSCIAACDCLLDYQHRVRNNSLVLEKIKNGM